MTDKLINAKVILKATEAEIRELLSYYGDHQLRDIQDVLSKHIKSIARKKKHFDEYWRCKDILKWARQEECSRPMTSDFLNDIFKIK